MNKLKSSIIVVSIVAVIVGLYFIMKPGKDSCDYETEISYSDAAVMGQILKADEQYVWKPNYYRCHSPKKGELTAYQLGKNPEMYVRVVAAAEGDVISITNDPNKVGYNLIVNGLRYGGPGGPFWFGVPGLRPTIALYLGADGTRKLGPGEIVVMGTGSPGFNDSGLFGLMSVPSMQGIVVLPKGDQMEFEKNLVWEQPKKSQGSDEEGETFESWKPATFSAPEIGNPSQPQAAKPQPNNTKNRQIINKPKQNR